MIGEASLAEFLAWARMQTALRIEPAIGCTLCLVSIIGWTLDYLRSLFRFSDQ